MGLITIFATDADWETEYESTVSQDLKKASAYAGHLLILLRTCLGNRTLYEPYASLGENLIKMTKTQQ